MVSTLKLTKIQIPNSDSDVISLDASTGNITLNKTLGGTSITVQGEGSATTNLQQGLSKCWSVNFTLAVSSGAVEDSFNLASTTDNSTGDASLNFTNVYANKGFASHVMAGNNGDVFGATKYADATTFARIQLYRQSTTSVVDNAFSATTHGDLA